MHLVGHHPRLLFLQFLALPIPPYVSLSNTQLTKISKITTWWPFSSMPHMVSSIWSCKITILCGIIYIYLYIYSGTSETDASITETSTMRTRVLGPKLFPIVHCTLQPPYSGNLPTLKYGHRSHAPTEKINTNFPLKTDSLMQDRLTGVRKLKNICFSWRV